MSIAWIRFVLLSIFASAVSSSNVLQDETDIQFRLPNGTKPETYDVFISTSVHSQNFTFEGSVSIVLLAESEASSITLHSHELHVIHAVSLLREDTRLPIQLGSATFDRINEFLTIPLANDALEAGQRYLLYIVFEGQLRDDARGFYKSSYVDDSGNVRYIATTQLGMTEARHAFPCFDEPELRANFTIRIRHGSNYHALSNMPIDGSPVNEFVLC